MTRGSRVLLLLLPAARLAAASVVTVPLPPPSEIVEPIDLLVGEKASVELDFPFPVADWVGKGFTPDATKFKGAFAIEATRGQPRIYLTALGPSGEALLHLTLEAPSGGLLSYPFRVIAAPEPIAWSQATFVSPATPPPRRAVSFHLPTEPSTPERELALLQLIRFMGDLPPSVAEKAESDSTLVWCANPAPKPEAFGGYTLTLLRLIQDRATADLVFEARLASTSAERLWLDPYSWTLRNADRLYRARTVDFTGTVEPYGSVLVAGVIAASPTGVPPYLDLDAMTLLSARLEASSSPRPVQTYDLPVLPRR